MKGFYIFEAETHKEAVDCLELGNIVQSFAHEFSPTTITEEVKMHALVTKTKRSPDDSYDFETGALIALMKMCGREKSLKAVEKLYSLYAPKGWDLDGDVFKNKLQETTDCLNDLSKSYDDIVRYCDSLREANKGLQEGVKRLKGESEKRWKNYQRNIQKKQDRINELEDSCDKYFNEVESLVVKKNELIEENEKLKLDCEKLQHGYNDTDNVPSGHWDGDILDMVFLPGRACGKQYKALVELFKKLDKKKVQEAYKEAYGDRIIWCTSQPEVHPLSTAVLEGVSFLNKKFKTYSIDEWLYKIPTRREKMWERILELHKENDVIIEVKKEDITTFLHEIEDKIPEITWASDNKIFETKYTMKDIYFELKTHDRIYFRLSKKSKLSYSSDPNTYLFKNLDMISYLPPMRWDLFKKGRLAVKVDYDNYKEFYEACKKELGKRPLTNFACIFTVSICKDDGFFEIFTVEDQKETGRKIVNWEDVR